MLTGFRKLIIGSITLCVTAFSYGATNSQLQSLGLISVKEYGAVGDGVTNDTVAIQNAIMAAKNANKVCLFPPGTYLVDQTLKCYKPMVWVNGGWSGEDGNNSNHRWKTYYLLGSTRGSARPVIKLKPNSAGFNNILGAITSPTESNKSKPVINMGTFCDDNDNGVWDLINDNGNGVWDSKSEGDSKNLDDTDGNAGEEANRGNGFYYNIRNIDFDLSGNKSAVAVRMLGAQSCGIQDVKVMANGAWGGFYDLAGSACVNGNLEVVGGRVGIYGAGGVHATSGAGVKLTGQSDYAFYHTGVGTLLVGFEITKASAPAVGLASNGDYSGGVGLIDGKISFDSTNGSPAVDNPATEEVFMAGVYVKNASGIVKSGNNAAVPGRAGWKKVSEYGVSDAAANGWNLINGSKVKSQVISVADCNESDVPTDLRARHSWDPQDFPTPDDIYDRIHTDNDPSCAIITEHGAVKDDSAVSNSDSEGTDNRAAIQILIDAGKKFILVPQGKFLIGKNPNGNYGLMLRDNTTLLGVAHNWSEIRSIESWNPTSESAVITTVDNATAAPKMAFLKISFQTNDNREEKTYKYSWFNGHHWKAGKNSITRQITLSAVGIYGSTSNNWYRTQARADNFFSGNAGGKHYGLGGSGAPIGVDEGVQSGENQVGVGLFRRFRITNTTQPLLLYNPNYEDGHDDPQSLVSGSSNVVVYGTKAENDKGFKFLNSTNCGLFIYGGKTDLKFENCSNMLAAIVTPKNKTHGTLIEVGATSLARGDTLGIFKRGTFNWENVTIHPPDDSGVTTRALMNLAAPESRSRLSVVCAANSGGGEAQ